MPHHNTLFLRLEGPLQSWGLKSKLVFRDSAREPTKSGVVGLLACALGRKRWQSVDDLAELTMGVRVDREGTLTRDYHTAGGGSRLRDKKPVGIGNITAAGNGVKLTEKTGVREPVVSVRMYLADASFLVTLQGLSDTIRRSADALQDPKWPIYLGRRSCPPSTPVLVRTGSYEDLTSALADEPWRPRHGSDDHPPDKLRLELEVPPADPRGVTRGDHPVYFWPPQAEESQFQQIPRHSARYVVEEWLSLEAGEFKVETNGIIPSAPPRQEGYFRKGSNSKLWKFLRPRRLEIDGYLCALTGLPADHVHHKKYRDDISDDHPQSRDDVTLKNHVEAELISLSRLAHEAVTMLEYRYDMGDDRINPLSDEWKPRVLEGIDEILRNRWRANQRRRKSR